MIDTETVRIEMPESGTVYTATTVISDGAPLYTKVSFSQIETVKTVTQETKIPAALRNCAQWVCWKNIDRDGKPTKIPVQPNGTPAKSSDHETWSTYQAAVAQSHKYAGIGFVFSVDDDFAGVDLDGCRDPSSGYIEPWASEIIERFEHAYIEVSPSRTGVKIFCQSSIQFDRGLVVAMPEDGKYGRKPAIEIYSSGRYFAVTGQVLEGRETLGDCTESVEWLKFKVQSIRDARKPVITALAPLSSTWSGHHTECHQR
jgi:primase-polymerase (primpol)-like protein